MCTAFLPLGISCISSIDSISGPQLCQATVVAGAAAGHLDIQLDRQLDTSPAIKGVGDQLAKQEVGHERQSGFSIFLNTFDVQCCVYFVRVCTECTECTVCTLATVSWGTVHSAQCSGQAWGGRLTLLPTPARVPRFSQLQ